MKPNGYQYAYIRPKTCQTCFIQPKEGGRGRAFRLFEVNGKKVCRACAKEARVI